MRRRAYTYVRIYTEKERKNGRQAVAADAVVLSRPDHRQMSVFLITESSLFLIRSQTKQFVCLVDRQIDVFFFSFISLKK